MVELGEERVYPGGDIGGVIVNGIGRSELGELDGGVDHGGFEALESLSHVAEIGGADLVAGAGEEAIDIGGFGGGGGGAAATAGAS